jgi:hypothetical protein
MNTTESARSGLCHPAVVVLGIAMMTIVGTGQAIDEAIRKINVDALPPFTGGFLLWMAVSYTVVAAGFLWIGFILAKGVPRCLTVAGPSEWNTGAEHVGGTASGSAGAAGSRSP